MVVLTMAVLLPTLQTAGIDLLWFGIFVVVVVEMAQVTPGRLQPVVLQGMTGARYNYIAAAAFPTRDDGDRGVRHLFFPGSSPPSEPDEAVARRRAATMAPPPPKKKKSLHARHRGRRRHHRRMHRATSMRRAGMDVTVVERRPGVRRRRASPMPG